MSHGQQLPQHSYMQQNKSISEHLWGQASEKLSEAAEEHYLATPLLEFKLAQMDIKNEG